MCEASSSSSMWDSKWTNRRSVKNWPLQKRRRTFLSRIYSCPCRMGSKPAATEIPHVTVTTVTLYLRQGDERGQITNCPFQQQWSYIEFNLRHAIDRAWTIIYLFINDVCWPLYCRGPVLGSSIKCCKILPYPPTVAGCNTSQRKEIFFFSFFFQKRIHTGKNPHTCFISERPCGISYKFGNSPLQAVKYDGGGDVSGKLSKYKLPW